MRSLVPHFSRRIVVAYRCDRCDRLFPTGMSGANEGYDIRIPGQVERDFQKHLCAVIPVAQPHYRGRARL